MCVCVCVCRETNVGYGSDYDRSGYGDREESSYRRSDHSSGAGADGETYYSNFSESPSRGYSRDYNHGSSNNMNSISKLTGML